MPLQTVGLIGDGRVLPGDGRLENTGSKFFGMVVLVTVWLATTWVIQDVVQSLYEVVILMAILTTLMLPLAILHLRGELDIFEPLVFANLSLATMFIGRPIFDISTDTWLHTWFATFFNARPGFDDMLLYAWLGILALQLGYLLRPLSRFLAKKLPTRRSDIDHDRAALIALLMFIIGAVLFEEYVRQSGGVAFLVAYITSRRLAAGFSFKAASGYLFIGPLFWPPAAIIALAIWIKSRKKSHLALALVSLTCFFVAMLGGVGRTFTLQGLLGIAIIVYVCRGKRPSMLLVLPLILVGLLYLVYDREARGATSFDKKELVLEKIAAHPVQGVATIWSEDDAAMCDYFSYIVSQIPERLDYGHGSTIGDVVLRAYPRFLWPNNQKPDEHMVYVFKKLYPAVVYRFATGAACSVIGELYADQGGLAVFIGMFIFGVVLAVPKQWMRDTGDFLPAQLLFVAMPAYTVSLMRGGVPAFVEYMAITAIPVFLITRYARAKA